MKYIKWLILYLLSVFVFFILYTQLNNTLEAKQTLETILTISFASGLITPTFLFNRDINKDMDEYINNVELKYTNLINQATELDQLKIILNDIRTLKIVYRYRKVYDRLVDLIIDKQNEIK